MWPKMKYRKICSMATGHRCFILKILYNQVLKLGKFVGKEMALSVLYFKLSLEEGCLADSVIGVCHF